MGITVRQVGDRGVWTTPDYTIRAWNFHTGEAFTLRGHCDFPYYEFTVPSTPSSSRWELLTHPEGSDSIDLYFHIPLYRLMSVACPLVWSRLCNNYMQSNSKIHANPVADCWYTMCTAFDRSGSFTTMTFRVEISIVFMLIMGTQRNWVVFKNATPRTPLTTRMSGLQTKQVFLVFSNIGLSCGMHANTELLLEFYAIDFIGSLM
ncbi:uncharacterized protein EDB91DRAFT_1271999 [Suillus paluster]|uniref:uncharacterized protein n=1 Tax=Suillus paluster TaxID=48578 RepID=UPI001B86CBF7|nr:uncharacterized protein EDB91DRAFT_1271999 [Suillus paluster]KAG1723173.1 hypothetical protein EDB91DRAFT_1271999 [Suillus paluster]